MQSRRNDGILYPLLTIPADMELSAVGMYGLLWLSYMKENHKGRFRTLTRLGCVNQTAHKVNEKESNQNIAEGRMGKQETKTENENYYLLTLAAMFGDDD